MKAPEAGNTVETLKPVDVFDAVKSSEPIQTIVLSEGQSLTAEQVSAGTAANGYTDVIIKAGLPSAADLDAVASEADIAAATAGSDFGSDEGAAVQDSSYISLEDEFVTRVEYNELLARITKFNNGSPHKL